MLTEQEMREMAGKPVTDDGYTPFVPKCDCMEKLTKVNHIEKKGDTRAREMVFIPVHTLTSLEDMKRFGWPVITATNFGPNGGETLARYDYIKIAYCPNCGTRQGITDQPATGLLAPSWAKAPVEGR